MELKKVNVVNHSIDWCYQCAEDWCYTQEEKMFAWIVIQLLRQDNLQYTFLEDILDPFKITFHLSFSSLKECSAISPYLKQKEYWKWLPFILIEHIRHVCNGGRIGNGEPKFMNLEFSEDSLLCTFKFKLEAVFNGK